jgi:hypothetical protein
MLHLASSTSTGQRYIEESLVAWPRYFHAHPDVSSTFHGQITPIFRSRDGHHHRKPSRKDRHAQRIAFLKPTPGSASDTCRPTRVVRENSKRAFAMRDKRICDLKERTEKYNRYRSWALTPLLESSRETAVTYNIFNAGKVTYIPTFSFTVVFYRLWQ